MTKRRIKEWYDYWDGEVYVSFSGGKDSTVLLDLIHKTKGIDDVPVVFCDTGLEYPEVREHALKHSDVILHPKMNFKQVIEKYGYPFPSKEQALYIRQYRNTKSEKLRQYRWNGWPPNGSFGISEKWKPLAKGPFEVSEMCCEIMKKGPFKEWEKGGRKPIIGTMASESRLRTQEYQQHGCNAFDSKRPKSMPLGFWTEQDILEYIQTNNLEIPSVYGEIVATDLFGGGLVLTGCQRTGCMFCLFGIHLDQRPNRLEKMKITHPKQYDYCINKLGIGEFLDFVGIKY